MLKFKTVTRSSRGAQENSSSSFYANVILIFFIILTCLVSSSSCLSYENNIAVQNFQNYLRINTAYPHPSYDLAIEWIKKQGEALGLEYNFLKLSNESDKFALWLTWEGLNPKLESIFLYSHIDVVAVDSEWTHEPFGGEIDDEGNIYGRGTQDMKSVGVQYLEAIRSMKLKGIQPNRTIHIGFFPDEEAGGYKGMLLFVLTPQFMGLNIGFALDEGMPNQGDESSFDIYYAQRTLHWIKFIALGQSGHGSLLLNDTAGGKIQRIINKLLNMREVERLRLENEPNLQLGDVTSINLNMLEGGIQTNIIPPKLSATFDIRFTPTDWNYEKIVQFVNDTCEETGANVTFEIIHSTVRPLPSFTKLDNSTWWWRNFQDSFEKMNLTLVPRIFPAGTDGEVFRRLGIPTIGFSPIFNTTMKFHDRNEYLNARVFLKGIEIYENLISSLAYVPPPPEDKKKKTTAAKAYIDGKGKGNSTGKIIPAANKKQDGKSSAATAAASKFSLLNIVILLFLNCYKFAQN